MGTEGRRLYIGGLPYKTDERDLRDLCDKFGHLEDGKDLGFFVRPVTRHLTQIYGPKESEGWYC